MSCLRKDGIHEARMIENRVASFDIAQQIDQRNMIVRRTGEGANDELKIRCREPRPTISLDHRGLIISFIRARRQESWRDNAFIHWAAVSCGDIRESRISFQSAGLPRLIDSIACHRGSCRDHNWSVLCLRNLSEQGEKRGSPVEPFWGQPWPVEQR